MRLRADQRRFADDLLALTVPNDKDDANGDKILVPLREVAPAQPGSGPSTIRRKDLQREVRVSANPDGRALGDIVGRHRGGCRRPSPCRRATTSSPAATPRS